MPNSLPLAVSPSVVTPGLYLSFRVRLRPARAPCERS